MTRSEAIAIIRKEYLCVDRDCDIERSCGKCDLMMPSKEPILEAYKMAINSLKVDEMYDLAMETAQMLIPKSVIEDIKAEIEEQVLESLSDGGDDWFTAEKVNECLEIIDKHIGKENADADCD